jgi:predicted O-methyltransferase YrrM
MFHLSAPSLCFFIAIAAWPILPSSAAEAKYEFTTDWVTRHANVWTEQLKHLKGKPNVHALEIGTFEGRSAIWFLENILIHNTSSITSIDIFAEKTYEDRFDRNIQASGVANKVRKIKGSSQKALRELEWNRYDFVYIDGSHTAKDVLVDAVLSWDLLKAGGIIVFDDYQWQVDQYKSWARPQMAIDAFLQVFEPYVDLLHQEYQVVVRKKEKVVLEKKLAKLGIVERSLNKTKRFFKGWLSSGVDRVKQRIVHDFVEIFEPQLMQKPRESRSPALQPTPTFR